MIATRAGAAAISDSGCFASAIFAPPYPWAPFANGAHKRRAAHEKRADFPKEIALKNLQSVRVRD
jgi:hypothetical protein